MLASLQKLRLTLRFRLFQRHRHRKLVIEHVAGHPIVVLPDVFNPVLFFSSALLAEATANCITSDDRMLDIGTGTGINAIVASTITRYVTAVDINAEAVRCARINAILNCVEDRIHVMESDLFGALADDKYDVVTFNPPFFKGQPVDNYDHAWRSENVIGRFAEELSNHLTSRGYALIVLSTNSDGHDSLQIFADAGLTTKSVVSRNMLSEVLTIYKLIPEHQ